MKTKEDSSRHSIKPPFLLLAVLGIHVAAAGFFMLMSGCQTRQPMPDAEPPPAPILPPNLDQVSTPPAAPLRPVMRPLTPSSGLPTSADASTYVVQKGDSLSKIAARAGVSVRELSELNNITNKDQIRIGQRLLMPAHARNVPSASGSAPSVSAGEPKKPSAPAKPSGDVHVVQSGDSLGKLAARYGTTSAAFREVNQLKSDTIRIGQKLVIPTGKKSATAKKSEPAPEAAAATPAPAPEPAAPVAAPEVAPAVAAEPPPAVDAGGESEAPFPYTVKEGDTLESIAMKFSARKDVIVRLNSLTSESVKPGQKLLIPWQ